MTTLRLPLHRPGRAAEAAPARPAFPPITSAEAALAAIDDWGAVLLFPARDVPIPSLWELWRGQRGPLASMAWDEIADVWHWKDAIAGRRAALFSHWLGGRHAFLAPRLIPALRVHRAGLPAADGVLDAQLVSDAERIVATLSERGPLPASALRRRCGLAAKSATARFNDALEDLETRLVVATVGAEGDDTLVADHHALVQTAFAANLAEAPSAAEAERELTACLERLTRWCGAEEAAIGSCLGWTGAERATS